MQAQNEHRAKMCALEKCVASQDNVIKCQAEKLKEQEVLFSAQGEKLKETETRYLFPLDPRFTTFLVSKKMLELSSKCEIEEDT